MHSVCRLAGLPSLIDDIRADLRATGVLEAVETPRHPGDLRLAGGGVQLSGCIRQGGRRVTWRGTAEATWADIQRGLDAAPPCPKLQSYWHFHDCRYHKGSGTCAEPDHLPDCPLPIHQLRNGQLNQTAYSLFLFLRDIADGDLVGWLDHRLAAADDPTAPDRLARLRQAQLPGFGLFRRWKAPVNAGFLFRHFILWC